MNASDSTGVRWLAILRDSLLARSLARATSAVVLTVVSLVDAGRTLIVYAPEPPHAESLDDTRVEALLNGGWIVLTVRRVCALWHTAWTGSAVRRWVSSTAIRVMTQPAPESIRLVGLTLALALATNTLMTRFSALVNGSLSVLVWSVLALASAIFVLKPDAIVAAWRDRTR